MQYKTHQSVTNLLQDSSDLRGVVTKVSHLELINQIVATKLDPSLAEHCRVANLRNGTLVLATTSPAWHHKLRFATLDLLSTLRADPRWSGLKAIDIRVDYLPNTETASPIRNKKNHHLSATNAQVLQQAAQSIAHHELAAALNRLAMHQTKTVDTQ